VVDAYNPSYPTGSIRKIIWGQPGLQSENLSQKQNTKGHEWLKWQRLPSNEIPWVPAPVLKKQKKTIIKCLNTWGWVGSLLSLTSTAVFPPPPEGCSRAIPCLALSAGGEVLQGDTLKPLNTVPWEGWTHHHLWRGLHGSCDTWLRSPGPSSREHS
jgi:hypothetical protein